MSSIHSHLFWASSSSFTLGPAVSKLFGSIAETTVIGLCMGLGDGVVLGGWVGLGDWEGSDNGVGEHLVVLVTATR